jgi:hypothetical protein
VDNRVILFYAGYEYEWKRKIEKLDMKAVYTYSYQQLTGSVLNITFSITGWQKLLSEAAQLLPVRVNAVGPHIQPKV